MKKDYRTKSLLILVFTALILVVWSYFLVLGAVKDKIEIVSNLESEIESLQRELQFIDSLKGVFNPDIPEQNLRKFFLEANGVVPFIEFLEVFGEPTGVKVSIQSVALSDLSVETKNTVEEIKIAVTFSGLWEEVYMAISLTESLPSGSFVDNLILRQSGFNKDGKRQWQASLGLNVLKLK